MLHHYFSTVFRNGQKVPERTWFYFITKKNMFWAKNCGKARAVLSPWLGPIRDYFLVCTVVKIIDVVHQMRHTPWLYTIRV